MSKKGEMAINSLKKYIKSFSLGFQSSIEYRANFLLSLLSIIFPIVMQYFLWTAIFKSSGKSIVYGFTYMQMISYSVLAGLISKLVATGFEYEVSDDIKNGGLSKFIVQPIGYFLYRISCFLGQKVLQSGIMLAIILVVLAVISKLTDFHIDIIRLIIFIPVLFLAIILNFLIAFSISAVAFWVVEISYLFVMTNMFVNIISGGVLPLEVFGPKILAVFNFLPFKYIIYYPVNVINGRLTSYEILQGLEMQCIWIVITIIISNVLWKIGTKQYTAVGG